MPLDNNDEIVISTGPIPGSRKTYVNAGSDGTLRVPFREVALEASANEPPVRLYDTSGPYTDGDASIDVYKGIARSRGTWIRARGDVEEYEGREIRPEDNHSGDKTEDTCPVFPIKNRPLRAKNGVAITQMAYARRGVITPEMEFIAARETWDAPSSAMASHSVPISRSDDGGIRAQGSRGRPRDHPLEHQSPGKRADGDRP